MVFIGPKNVHIEKCFDGLITARMSALVARYVKALPINEPNLPHH